MSSYNYATFAPDHYDLQSADGPDVGQRAPDFTLHTADGQPHRLLDFAGEALVLELGSVTCPLFLSRQDGMVAIARDYPAASHAVLYVREAHPGAVIPAHRTMAEKRACARTLTSDLDDPRTILVDDLDGPAHNAYGSLPNAVYIIDRTGTVRFKAPWNSASATRKALDAILSGRAVTAKSYFKPAKPWVVLSTLRRAGKGSGADFLHGLPRLIWNNLIRNNLRTLLKR